MNDDELKIFMSRLSEINFSASSTIEEARNVISQINNFLYTNYEGLGETNALGSVYPYLSEFHKYWERNHREILDCQVNEEKCREVAVALHQVFLLTNGSAFSEVYDTCGLTKEQICRVRFLTANQDFRGSRSFSVFARKYIDDSSIFDVEAMINDPATFVSDIGITGLSQDDKRISYAKNIASFLKQWNITEPYDILSHFGNDISQLREAMISCAGAGYGNKKTDMFLRDMVVLKVWENVRNFDVIDVASDINTIKVALRTGIIRTAIPLLSSFMDIFCHQYSYIDEMNALAWRRVWEIWTELYPNESIASPCLIDYFIYNVVGKQFCKEILVKFQCDKYPEHRFDWHSGRNKTCQICVGENKGRNPAHLVAKVMPCSDENGCVAILKTEFVLNLPKDKMMSECPFKNICAGNKGLQPPKSISILGQTGWTSAYTRKGDGGGGLMA